MYTALEDIKGKCVVRDWGCVAFLPGEKMMKGITGDPR